MTDTDHAAAGDARPNGDAHGGATPNGGDPGGGGIDASYQEFLARAGALAPGSVGAADMLLDEIANSALPPSTFKSLTATIGKATGLDGGALYRQLGKMRAALEPDEPAVEVRLLFAEDPEPAPDPLLIGVLLDQIVKIIIIRVYCSPETADGLALWTLGTWGVFPPSDPSSGPDLYPYLGIMAPMPRCGKTTLLETVQVGVRRPLSAADISQAALYRSIEKYGPTLLLDEFDQLIKKNPELTGLLNSGHTRNGTVIRAVEVQVDGAKTFEPVPFSTFSPKVLSGIGNLPPTLADRTLRARLERQPRGNNRRRVSGRQLREIRDKLIPHCVAHADAIGAAMAAGVPDSAIPPTLNDRDADNWNPLLAIAALAGPDWLARAQRAAVALCADSVDAGSGPERLLAQIVEAVGAQRRTAVDEYLEWRRGGRKPLPMGRRGGRRPTRCLHASSDVIADWLMAKDDSGFAGMRDIGSVRQRVANTLRPFKITPKQRKVGSKPVRGYDVAQLRAVWRQYRP